MNLQKSIRWDSKKYRTWVCTLPCVYCGREGWPDNQVVPHHSHGIGHGGMSIKASDELTMPMHATCHNLWHSNPDHDAQWRWLVDTMSKAILAIANGELVLK